MYLYEKNLNKATKLLDGSLLYNEDYFKIYSFSTENISGYLDYFDLKNKRLLTVGSSGDQVINAYYCGARDITLFDINTYSKYYLYLKISAIISLSYDEFQKFFFKYYESPFEDNKYMFSKELFNKIKSNLRLLDYESYLFFDEIFNLYEPKRIRDYLFDDDESRKKVIKGLNIYLKNENNYNILKNKVRSISFKYINGDLFKYKLNEKYDNIFLSNLCTYYSLGELMSLLKYLSNNNLNMNGSILFSYLWNIDFNESYYEDDWKEIYKMPIIKEKLKKYISEYHNIIGTRDILHDEEKKRDLVLIYKKKR